MLLWNRLRALFLAFVGARFLFLKRGKLSKRLPNWLNEKPYSETIYTLSLVGFSLDYYTDKIIFFTREGMLTDYVSIVVSIQDMTFTLYEFLPNDVDNPKYFAWGKINNLLWLKIRIAIGLLFAFWFSVASMLQDRYKGLVS